MGFRCLVSGLFRLRRQNRNLPRSDANHTQHLDLFLSSYVEDDAIVAGLRGLNVAATEATAAATSSATTTAPGRGVCELARLG